MGVGADSVQPGLRTVGIGEFALGVAPGEEAIGIGYLAGNDVAGARSVSIGAKTNSVNAFGLGSFPAGSSSVTVGYLATATGTGGVSLGSSADAIGQEAVAIGRTAMAEGLRSIAIGYSTTAPGADSVNVGGVRATGDQSTTMGHDAECLSLRSSAYGFNATASGEEATAIGANTVANYARATAIGVGAATAADDEVAIGVAVGTVRIDGTLNACIDYSSHAFAYGRTSSSTFSGQAGARDLFEGATITSSTLGILQVGLGVPVTIGGGALTIPMTIFTNPTVENGGDGRTRVAIVQYYYLPEMPTSERLEATLVKTNPDNIIELPFAAGSRVSTAVNSDVTPTIGATGFVVLAAGDGFGVVRSMHAGPGPYSIYEVIVTGVLL